MYTLNPTSLSKYTKNTYYLHDLQDKIFDHLALQLRQLHEF